MLHFSKTFTFFKSSVSYAGESHDEHQCHHALSFRLARPPCLVHHHHLCSRAVSIWCASIVARLKPWCIYLHCLYPRPRGAGCLVANALHTVRLHTRGDRDRP